MQLSKEWAEVGAKKLFPLWHPALRSLQSEYDPSLFAALVAFLGIHGAIWPLWLASCSHSGVTLEPAAQTFRLLDAELSQKPWVTLFRALDPTRAWVYVSARNLPAYDEIFPDLMHSDMVLTMQTFTKDRKPVVFGRADAAFARWGVYSATHVLGDLREVLLPVISCERLQYEWPRWWQSAEPLSSTLLEIAQLRIQAGRGSAELRDDFLVLTDSLWALLLAERVIQTSSLRKGISRKLMGMLRRPECFKGILILLGDHQQLWREMQASYAQHK